MNSEITKDSPEALAFRCFGEEYEHLETSKLCHKAGNHQDGNGFQETADMCLDLGWQTLEDAGWRHRDIAKFRHAAHEQWPKLFGPDRLTHED